MDSDEEGSGGDWDEGRFAKLGSPRTFLTPANFPTPEGLATGFGGADEESEDEGWAKPAWGDESPDLKTQDSLQVAGEDDATLRVEFVNKFESALLGWLVWAWSFVALGLTLAIFVLKFTLSADSTLFGPNPSAWWLANLSVAAVALAALLCSALNFVVLHTQVRLAGKHWSTRRRLFTVDAGIMSLLALINTTFWVAPCALVAARPATWFVPAMAVFSFGRWTCYNLSFVWMVGMAHGCCQYKGKVRNPNPNRQLVMDVPFRRALWLHAPKTLLWVAMQLTIVAKLVLRLRNPIAYPVPPGQSVDCAPDSGEVVVMAVKFVLLVGYSIAYLHYMRRAFRNHRALPFTRYRMTNMYLRIQARHGSSALALVVLSAVALELVLPKSCWSFAEVMYGMAPAQLAMVVLALVDAYLMTPKGTHAHSIMDAWLQEFSWTEMGLARAKDDRKTHLAQMSKNPLITTSATAFARVLSMAAASVREAVTKRAKESTIDKLNRQPMFCFELVAKLWHWSQLAYRYEHKDRPMPAEYALELFQLEGLREIWSGQEDDVDTLIHSDTRALLGWRDGVVVLAFRGTTSVANVQSDLKIWSTKHQPARKHKGGAQFVKVHAGFYEAYTWGGYSERLMAALREVVAGFSSPTGHHFYVTGHSLGGALAALAAHDIVQGANAFEGANVHVYTFGAPRLGNGAWKAEYLDTVPDTWSLINDQDPVPRLPPHAKRTGHRVVVNARGDIIVRPSQFEHTVLNRSGGSALHHKMGQYALALSAVLKAQYNPSKCLVGGADGVADLDAYIDFNSTLVLTNSSLEDLKNASTTASPGNLATPKESLTPRTPVAKRRSMGFSCIDLCLDSPDVKESAVKAAGVGEPDLETGRTARRKDSTSVLQRHISFASDEGGGGGSGRAAGAAPDGSA